MRARILIQRFEFRVGIVLCHFEALPDCPPFGQFRLVYEKIGLDIALPLDCPRIYLDHANAERISSEIAEAESELACAAQAILSGLDSSRWESMSPILWFAGARNTLRQLQAELSIDGAFRAHDEHFWSFVGFLYKDDLFAQKIAEPYDVDAAYLRAANPQPL